MLNPEEYIPVGNLVIGHRGDLMSIKLKGKPATTLHWFKCPPQVRREGTLCKKPKLTRDIWLEISGGVEDAPKSISIKIERHSEDTLNLLQVPPSNVSRMLDFISRSTVLSCRLFNMGGSPSKPKKTTPQKRSQGSKFFLFFLSTFSHKHHGRYPWDNSVSASLPLSLGPI